MGRFDFQPFWDSGWCGARDAGSQNGWKSSLLDGTSREKYFDFCKSLPQFDTLTTDEEFRQVLLKSDKPTYRITFI